MDGSKIVRNVDAIGSVPKEELEQILQKYAKVFSEGLGMYTGPAVKLLVDSETKPKFCSVRLIPYAWRDKVDQAREKNGGRCHRADHTLRMGISNSAYNERGWLYTCIW